MCLKLSMACCLPNVSLYLVVWPSATCNINYTLSASHSKQLFCVSYCVVVVLTFDGHSIVSNNRIIGVINYHAVIILPLPSPSGCHIVHIHVLCQHRVLSCCFLCVTGRLAPHVHHHRRQPLLRLVRALAVQPPQARQQGQVWQAVCDVIML